MASSLWDTMQVKCLAQYVAILGSQNLLLLSLLLLILRI